MMRMGQGAGRSDDIIIIRGVNVFPTQVESVLVTYTEVQPHYLLVGRAGLQPGTPLDGVGGDERIRHVFRRGAPGGEVRRRIHHDLESLLGLSVTVKLVEPKSIDAKPGKCPAGAG
jgi:phenylacetate-CoA ligase